MYIGTVDKARQQVLAIHTISVDAVTQGSEHISIMLSLKAQSNIQNKEPFLWYIRLLDGSGGTMQELVRSSHRYGIPFGAHAVSGDIFLNTVNLVMEKDRQEDMQIIEITPFRFAVRGSVLQGLLNTKPDIILGTPLGVPYLLEL